MAPEKKTKQTVAVEATFVMVVESELDKDVALRDAARALAANPDAAKKLTISVWEVH